MKNLALPFLSIALLSACGGPGGEIGIRESGASGSTTVAADYVPVAECSKDALERKEAWTTALLMPHVSIVTGKP